MKKLQNHTIHEIYCEWDADIVFVDHKPTDEELKEITKEKEWFQWGSTNWEEQKKYLSVNKLDIYSSQ